MLSYIYGVLAFICLMAAPGALEGGMYITSFILILFVWIFGRLSMYEAGMIRRKKGGKR